ncbi:MAG: hypothetical protein WAU05_10750 [Nitrospira sp.]
MLDAGKSLGVGETVTPFGTTDFATALTEARANNPTAIALNLYGWESPITRIVRRAASPILIMNYEQARLRNAGAAS